MNLVLDIGNSSAKIALFDNNKLIEKAICSINEIHEISDNKIILNPDPPVFHGK